MNTPEFETFKDDLRSQPEEYCLGRLAGRIDRTEKKLLRTHKGTDVTLRRQAVADFALLAMAEERAYGDVEHNPFEEPSWMVTAREMLSEFKKIHPTDRRVLDETVFFNGDNDARKAFARHVSAAIEPAGEYDDTAFINGVALGDISIKEMVAPPPVR